MRPPDAIEAAGRRVVAGELDVRDARRGRRVRRNRRTSELGPVDVLVNNAGGGFYARFLDVNAKGQDSLDPRELRERHALHPRRRAADARAGGSIINITSIEAHRAAPGFAVYSAMKAGVASLTKSLALELGAAPDPGQLHRARRDPDARHRRWRSGVRHAAADRAVTSTTSRRRPSYLASDLSPVRHRHDDPRRRRQPRRGRLAPRRRRQLRHRPRRHDRTHDREVRHRARAGSTRRSSSRATLEAERLGYESVWLPEHLIFTTPDEPLAAPGRDPPAGPARHADLRRVRVPRVPRGQHRAAAARHPRLQPRPAPPVRRGARGADARHRLRRAVRVRHRRELARRGVDRRRARLRDARPARRRGARGVQAAVDRGRRRRSTASSSTSTARCSSPSACRSPGHRSWSAARAAPRCGARRVPATAGSAWPTTFETGAAQITKLRELLDAEPAATPTGFQFCLGGPVDSADDVERWEDVGVTRLVVLAVAPLAARPSTACAPSPRWWA